MVQNCALRRNDTPFIADTSSESIEQPCRGLQSSPRTSTRRTCHGLPCYRAFQFVGLLTTGSWHRLKYQDWLQTLACHGLRMDGWDRLLKDVDGTTVSLQYSTVERERPSHIQGHLGNDDQPRPCCRRRCVPTQTRAECHSLYMIQRALVEHPR